MNASHKYVFPGDVGREDGDFDIDEINQLDDLQDSTPWPPPNLSAIDLPLALMHANTKHRVIVLGGLCSSQYERLH